MKTHAPFFDRLCAVSERWLPGVEPWLRQARLFLFEQKAYELVRPTLTEDEVEFLNTTFFLPFPVVAVEDPASVVVLVDLDPDARGVGARRAYVELVDGRGEGFGEDEQGPPLVARQVFRGATLVQMGWFSMRAGMGARDMVDRAGRHTGFELQGQMEQACWFQGDPRANAPEVLDGRGLTGREQHAFLRNPVTALEELWATNVPSRFVVESTPRRVRDPGRSRRVPRSHERPVYTLLEPAAIRRQYVPVGGPPQRTGRRVRPHERRRHYRTLRSDRFTHMQGRTVAVAATWVGPTEAVVGNRRYRVMLEL